MTMVTAHSVGEVSVIKSNVALVALLLSVGCVDATILSFGCCSTASHKSLAMKPTRKAGVQYPFCLSPVQVEKMMHKPNFNVMGLLTCSLCCEPY